MIEMVIEDRQRHLSGIDVGRVLPFAKRRMVGPFIFFDHMGPLDLPAGVGREVDVLVESREAAPSQGGGLVSIGRTYRDAPEVDGLAFLKGEYPMGAMVRARVDGAMPYDLLCSPVAVPAAR